MSLALKWTFPPTGGGVAQGFNDGAQEHFRNNAWKNTIREIIQNSLDAVQDSSKPVTVVISKIKVPSSEIGAGDLAGHVKAALKRVTDQNENDGKNLYNRALDILGRDTIETLAITDSNTTGLVDGGWDALVYNEGTTNKGGIGAAGGSFGLGKNAPYLVSDLKAVCYSTRYLKRGRREDFIARCKLVAHDDPAGKNGELQHIGFATKARVKAGQRVPPTQGRDVYHGFRLHEVGSGIFIVGFNPLTKDWQKVAARSIAENFFAAVHEKKLRIKIDSEWITHETLDGIFEQDRKNRSLHYYRVVRNHDATTAEMNGDLGRLIVKFSIGEDHSPNRIAYINRRGMLITDAGQRSYNPFHTTLGSGWAKYAAVVYAADDKTDKKIREMEPPNHGTIECGRIIDPTKREKMWRELDEAREKIAEIIGNALRHSIKDQEINVSELADIMAIDDEGSAGKGEHDTSLAIDLPIRQIKPHAPGKSAVPENGEDDSEETKTGHEGTSKGGQRQGTGPTTGKPPKPASVVLEKVRILRINGRMRVAFTPRPPVANARLTIRPAGEVRMRERPLCITGASVVDNAASARIESDGATIDLSSLGSKRILLDLDVDKSTEPKEYTGYEIVCASTGGSP